MTGNNDKPTHSETPEELAEETTAIDTTDDAVDNSVSDTHNDEINDTDAINNTDDAEQNTAEIAVQDTLTTTHHAHVDKQSSNKGILLLLLIILLSLGVAIGAYYGWQEYQKQLSRLQILEGNTAEQTHQQQNLSQQLSKQQEQWTRQQQQQFQALQEAQTLLQQRLDSHSTRIQGLAGTSRQDWLLAEVRYLLRLANQRLLVEQNTLGAQGLLEAADKILQSIDDNGLLPVRDALAKELIALKIADTVDKEGLYLKISALKEQIQALPLIPFLNEDNNAEKISLVDETEVIKTEQTWYQNIFSSIKNALADLADIGNLIQVRQHDTAPELLISEQQQYQVLNHLTLMLEQAQFALLHEKKSIYRDSLSKAQQWWSTYYGHYREHEAIKSEITDLKQQAITQTLPNISRSSKLISEYIEQFHQTDRSATASQKPENDTKETN